MSIEIRTVDDPDEWNDLVADSDTPTPFHHTAALDVLADAAGASLDRLAGYKGEEPCGIFPVFTQRRGPVTLAFSPPPNLKVPYLGPALLNTEKLKQRRLELRHSRFVDAAVEWVEEAYDPWFTTLRTPPGYADIRPFTWNEFEITPRYTYVVDLTRDPDDLLAAFSADARKNVTDDHDTPYVIEEGGPAEIEAIVEHATERHAEQGESFPIDAPFVVDLYEALPDGVVRPIVCRSGETFAGGLLNLELGDAGTCWVGVANFDVDLPATDLLDWWYIQQAVDRGVATYDLAGANNRRLSKYKAKFAPDLVPYFRAEAGSFTARTAAELYGRFR